MIGDEAADGVEEDIEGDCRMVGEDRSSSCDVVLLLLLVKAELLVGCACFACSGGSIIVIDVKGGCEGGE